jgi:transcription-repair coupling factor (superfamily II helicase)
MILSGLPTLLQDLPAYTELLRDLRSGSELPPQALLSAARPLVLAALRRDLPGPILFITARSEMAQQMVELLSHWLPPADQGGPGIYQFAEPDALPFERIPWSSATRQRRLTALAALQSRSSPAPIVIASTRSLMQKTLPPRELRLSLRPLRVGQQLRLDQTTLLWAQTGYNPADVVEEPGTFARRGGIVDIWPPNLAHPVRIDLFGDEIESLRLFDPATQRTLGRVDTIDIGPGSEAVSKYGPAALERLGVRSASLSAPESVGDHSLLRLALAANLLGVRESQLLQCLGGTRSLLLEVRLQGRDLGRDPLLGGAGGCRGLLQPLLRHLDLRAELLAARLAYRVTHRRSIYYALARTSR